MESPHSGVNSPVLSENRKSARQGWAATTHIKAGQTSAQPLGAPPASASKTVKSSALKMRKGSGISWLVARNLEFMPAPRAQRARHGARGGKGSARGSKRPRTKY